MQTSQTLKDLVSSAKANQEEFNNTLIEIHKQSALQIGSDLKISLENEMNLIKQDIESKLSPIVSQTENLKSEIMSRVAPSLTARIFNGIVLSVAMVFLILGFLANFWLGRHEIEYYQSENKRLREQNQILSQWQIPTNYRYTQQNKATSKTERYLILPPKTTITAKDGSQYLQLSNGGL